MFCGGGGGGSKSAKGGPNPLADLDRGGPNPRGVQIRCDKDHLNLSKSYFVSEEDHSGGKSQNIAIRALKGNVLCQTWFKWTY